ncbi:MAG TPA: hypothetical protein VGG43_03035 [Acidimicrobiales bacterium]|jgi:hypothetical protein
MAAEIDANSPGGPICPNCEQPLRIHLRQDRLAARGASAHEPPTPVLVTFCGNCGWTLATVPGPAWITSSGDSNSVEVADPEDETTLEGQFQLRCRDLVTEIRTLGFTPVGWIGLINRLGAAQCALQLLADRRILPVTHWLVNEGHPELTLEHEMEQPRWADLFTDDDREEASWRLTIAGDHPEH